MYKDVNGKVAARGLQGHSGVTYGNTKLFSAGEIEAMLADGIEEVTIPTKTPFDARFYWDVDVPKSLDDIPQVDDNGDPILDENGNQMIALGLKSIGIEQTKVTANTKLSPSDWMVVKAAEVDGYTVPQEVLDYRAAVRTASNTIEAAITAAADLAALMALYEAPVDGNGDPTGAFAPVYDWPAEI